MQWNEAPLPCLTTQDGDGLSISSCTIHIDPEWALFQALVWSQTFATR